MSEDDPIWVLATKIVQKIGYYSLWSLPREHRERYLRQAWEELQNESL